MNLGFTSFLKILAGGIFGAAIFCAVSFLLPGGLFEPYESVLGHRQICSTLGALLGAAVTTIALVVRDSHRPETGAAKNFSMINGMGSMLIGKSDLREDGSYLTTEWFCMLWLPLFPVCNYRVMKVAQRVLIPFLLGSQHFAIQEKHPVRLKHVVKGYAITAAVTCIIGLVALFFICRG